MLIKLFSLSSLKYLNGRKGRNGFFFANDNRASSQFRGEYQSTAPVHVSSFS